MGRTPRSTKQNIHQNNNSILEEGIVEEYDQLIKKFPDIEPAVRLDQLIGCESQVRILQIELDTLINRDDIEPEFIILEGPMETGKTAIVKLLAKEYQKSIKFFYLKAPWLFSKKFDYVPTRLELLFDEASRKQPALIFIDEIDCLCSSKKQNESKENLIYHTLLDQMYICKSNPRSRVMVVAATNKSEVLDAQTRKYFKKEIQFSYLNEMQRVEALKVILEKFQHDLDKHLSNLACNMACYSYESLKALCIEAYKIAEAKNLMRIDVDSFRKAQETMKAATAKSVVTPCQKLRWSDIGGNHKIKEELIESVIWPIQDPEDYQRHRLEPPKGALLYGPPGCSKTMMARALATESTFNFICIKGPQLLSKWVGDTEAEVRKLYKNAKMIAPCIIFFDEFDGIASRRTGQSNNATTERVVAQLLSEIDSVEPLDGVFTMAATNMPHLIDEAFLRPGRLESVIYMPLPSRDERKEIFDIHLKKELVNNSIPININSDKLADRTNGYSGAEIMGVCRRALLAAYREKKVAGKVVEHVGISQFDQALKEVKPNTSAKRIKYFEKFRDRSFRNPSYIREDQLSTKSAQRATSTLYKRLSMRMGRLFKK